MRELRLATRRSPLALAQANRVADVLRRAHPDLIVSLVPVATSGDQDRSSSVTALTEVGAFVGALQHAVRDGRVDAAVHSCKDLPASGSTGLIAAAYPEREDPRDVLVGSNLRDLPPNATVGTGSPRRSCQLRALRPDVNTPGIRGNVNTRLDQVKAGRYDAAVLAAAGLNRLGRGEAAAYTFPIDTMVPAPAQGTLVVETRADDPAAELIATIDDPTVRLSTEIERGLLAVTGARCRSALGAHATAIPGGWVLTAYVNDDAGSRFTVVTGEDHDGLISTARRELNL